MSSNLINGVGYYQIMQKVFALLLSELRKLRASIVFADFSRIIIATGKYNMAAAQGYCEYLLKTLKSRYLLSIISHHFLSLPSMAIYFEFVKCLVNQNLFLNIIVTLQ